MRTLILLGSLLVSLTSRAAVTCKTADLELHMQLVLPSGELVGDAAAPYVFGAAECQCHSTDVALQIQIWTAISLARPNGQLQVWTGIGCDQPVNRTPASTQCRLIDNTGLSYHQFVQGTTEPTVDLPLPSDLLFGDSCDPVITANNVYLVFAPDNDLTNAETCSFPLQESTLIPQPAIPSATATQGAVTLDWTAPAPGAGQVVPFGYQVLCADVNQAPLPGRSITTQGYSVCNAGVVSRRGTLPITAPTSAFTALDPAFRCSEVIPASGSNLTVRIDGLDADQEYQFIVVAVDAYGNPSPSPLIGAHTPPDAPAPPPASGCGYAGTRPTPGVLGLVLLLLLTGAGARRRSSS